MSYSPKNIPTRPGESLTRPTLALVALAALLAVPAAAQSTPAAPSQVRAATLSDERVRLRWQDNSCDESAFILQVESADTWLNVPFALEANTSAVILSGLEPATTYRFRMVAANGAGFSEPSEPTEVRTFATQPSCLVTPYRLCLMDGRYAVTATFEAEHFTGARFAAHAVPDGARTGSFWFFDANNLELGVEITDGTAINGHIWVSAGGLSNLEYRIRIVDTVTGEARVYVNPTDDLCGIDDRQAFLTPLAFDAPEPKKFAAKSFEAKPLRSWPTFEKDDFRPLWRPTKAACGLENPATLRLLDGRFELSLDWRGDDGVVRTAHPRYDSRNSGFFITGEPDLADWAVKILDGRFFNQHYWLFWTPLSGREAWLRVTDTVTGAERRMYNARGSFCSSTDTAAFEALP